MGAAPAARSMNRARKTIAAVLRTPNRSPLKARR
jgi:hypothetical protein